MNPDNILDQSNKIKQIDQTNMVRRINQIPDMLGSALNTPINVTNLNPPSDVILVGMGGSAIACDLLKDYMTGNCSVPTTVVREPILPYKTTPKTLLILNSFSGNTEETITMFKKGYESGCQIIVVTSGGQLEHLANEKTVPIIKMTVNGEPRSTVPYHFLVLIQLFKLLKLTTLSDLDIQSALESACESIKEYGLDNPISNNLAKQLAIKLKDKLPCIYGGGLFNGMTLRWKTQINENAKSMCVHDSLPELFHNTIESIQEYESINSKLFILVIEPSTNPTWLQKRYTALQKLLSQFELNYQYIKSDFSSNLEQIVCMMCLSDYTSFYLGILKNVDPASTNVIDSVKKMVS